MLGTNMTWQEIFEQTDHDINLQRVMNATVFGKDTGKHDWIPERAIGPIDDDLYDAEKTYHDEQLSKILGKSLAETQRMGTEGKREILMSHRKEQLVELIRIYYDERGWNSSGLPTITTLKRIGLWEFLNQETRSRISEISG
ncbi:MAG: aldehyde ferredoxin oxidoreductase C-terminal domain-containing protein [bacterium]